MSEAFPVQQDMTAIAPEIVMRLGQGLIGSGAALALFSPADDLHFATAGFISLYDVQAGPQTFSSLMRHCWQAKTGPLIITDNIDTWLAAANAKRRSQSNRQFEIDIHDGRWMWVNEITFPDDWVLVIVSDFTSVKRREFKLESDRHAAVVASETDHLTGLYNRGATLLRLTQLIEHSAGSADVFSAVLIDLDHFKSINDRFGHDSGDQVLMHFAACAEEVLREKDILGRVGGEEFLLIMPGATQNQAASVLERLRAHLSDQRLKLRGTLLKYTFSAGVAQWGPTGADEPAKTVEALYREADQALYAAKDSGRNQVYLAG
jgi:diguanylate cyclase (GGDEF)-like protein